MKCAVIFGGSGFIGCFFADFLIRNAGFEKVYLYDLESWEEKPFPYRVSLVSKLSGVEFVKGDVRREIEWVPSEKVDLVANFAAVHREPGHEDFEYFETNLLGAENVTSWASKVQCHHIIFTSSISPYGVSESLKDEQTLPVPVTAYGSSKLAAEKIHLAWQAKNSQQRKLVIARPGVVFGPGEGGNVTRLVKAVKKGYFVYMSNKGTRKAGIYVKELCNAMWWVCRRQQEESISVVLFNASMNPGPSISEYVETVCEVAGIKRFVPTVPYPMLLFISYLFNVLASPLGIKHPFSPVRIRKLVRSNNIIPSYLNDNGYVYLFDLVGAMYDWRTSCPEEWT